jgi:hypothetical protein
MAEAYIDYPDDPEKLNIHQRLRGTYDAAGFYPPARTELTETLALVDNFPGSVWEHLSEVEGHQGKALKRVKAPESAVAALVYGYKESAEDAVENVHALDDLYQTASSAYLDTLNPKLGLASIASQESKKAVILATRYRDMKMFAEQSPKIDFNPLDVDYFDPESESFIEQRINEAFDSKGLPEIIDFLLESRQDQLNRAIFHTDVLKFCRRLRPTEAARTAGEAVRRLVQIFPVPTTLDSIQTMAAK